MGMNNTPAAERIHIGIFGRRNAGKSSLINAMTGQNLSIVSDVQGTTTDPVHKSMELLPLGPVVLIDTPGIDDEGKLGALRVARSYQMLNKTDIGILVLDINVGLTVEDEKLLERIKQKQIPCLIVLNQSDRLENAHGVTAVYQKQEQIAAELNVTEGQKIKVIAASAQTGYQIQEVKEMLAKIVPDDQQGKRIVGDLLDIEKITILVVPIDKAAPKGRLILPQQQTIRDILESGGACVVVRDVELKQTLHKLDGQVGLVITDSQAFKEVSKIVPENIPLTSFSILFARYKGELLPLLEGVNAISTLKDGDKVLISEGCTHHRQCNDIGTVKMPGWITQASGKKLEFVFTSGGEFPQDLTEYGMIVHCGGCMLNAKEMKYRIACAQDANVPITNYGMMIAKMTGILERSLEPILSKQ